MECSTQGPFVMPCNTGAHACWVAAVLTASTVAEACVAGLSAGPLLLHLATYDCMVQRLGCVNDDCPFWAPRQPLEHGLEPSKSCACPATCRPEVQPQDQAVPVNAWRRLSCTLSDSCCELADAGHERPMPIKGCLLNKQQTMQTHTRRKLTTAHHIQASQTPSLPCTDDHE